MKVAAQGVGYGGTKLRNSNKMVSGESKVKEKGKAALSTSQALHFHQENVQ